MSPHRISRSSLQFVLISAAILGITNLSCAQSQDVLPHKEARSSVGSDVVNRVRLWPRAGFASRLQGVKIQGSNLNATSGFVDLATIDKAPQESQWLEVKFPNSSAYDFVRLYFAPDSWGNVAEVEFYAGDRKIQGEFYGTAGSRDKSGRTFEKAFDGKLNTFFDAPLANAQYVGIAIRNTPSAPLADQTNLTIDAQNAARRHYHVGNSLTDTIGEFTQSIARSAGYDGDFFDRQTIPGSPLYLNWESTGGFGTNYRQAFIKHAPLTDLVLQTFISNGDSQSAEFSLKFYNAARINSPHVQPWIYGQWPQTGTGQANAGSADWEERTLGLMRIYTAHALNFNAEITDKTLDGHAPKMAKVIPGGLALVHLKRAVDAGRVPGMTNFFAANFEDDLHLNLAGRYFIGLLHYAMLYEKSPVGTPLVGLGAKMPALSAEQTRLYQQIAWETATQLGRDGGAESAQPVPASLDARAHLNAVPPFRDPFVRYISANSRFDYVLNATKAGAYELRVFFANDKADRVMKVTLNHQEVGTLTAPVTAEQKFTASQPLTLTLKNGVNLLSLYVPENRPYDFATLSITPVGQPTLNNTRPLTSFSPSFAEVKSGASWVELFNVSDAETPGENLRVAVTADNALLVPAANIKIESGEFKNQWNQRFNRRLTVTPATAQNGETQLTLTITDQDETGRDAKSKAAGALHHSQRFNLTVK